MHNTEAALSQGAMFKRAIPIALVDPAERAGYAARPLEFRAVNDAVMPGKGEARESVLADLSQFLRTGNPGNLMVVEENLRDSYLVDIGADHRISRKVFAIHPLMPNKLLAIGGVGLVRPDERNHCLTLQTPIEGMTLHRFFPDLLKASMSAGYPTPQKTIQSTPNVDPIGGYSLKVAEAKYRHVQMITEGRGGVDPRRFPVIANVAWGTVGQGLAFYVYALPANAVPVTELLQASSREEILPALGRYMRAGRKLVRALRHLHGAGYVFNQAHQGNVYCYQDAEGADQIVIADMDTLQSIQDFDRKVPKGQYLSPRAFATLVNLLVAATNVAQIAWIDFLGRKIRELRLKGFPGLDGIYASVICDLLTSYIRIPKEAHRAGIHNALMQYYRGLARQGANGRDQAQGAIRLLQSDLYETDVSGVFFTHTLMNAEYCKQFGARILTEGITQQSLEPLARATMRREGANSEALARALDQAMNQIIQERATQAMQELVEAHLHKSRADEGP